MCNIFYFRILSGSHSTIFHTVTLHSTSLSINTLHQLEPSETFLKVTHLIITQSQTRLTMKFLSNVLLKSSPFRDLENQLCLLLGSMNDPTNQHKTFQRVRLSLRGFLGNFPEGHPSHNYSKPNTLNYGVLK
ncbi:hypothetical protein HKD37_12G033667 [Glycine soja]